jgi:outer membrane protein TolC
MVMKHVVRNAKVWALVFAATGATSIGLAAQQPPPPAAPPAPAPAAAPAAPAQGTTPADRYVVGQAVPNPQPGTTLRNLSLEDAMQVALENNLDLKVARMAPQIQDYTLRSARSAFLPRITSTYQLNNNTQPSNNVLDRVNNVSQNTQNFNGTLSEVMPWYGGNLTINFTNSRQGTNSAQARLNPAFNSRLNFSYAQPLLAGWNMDTTRNTIRTATVQRQITDLQLQSSIENTKASVRTAYWNLRQAIEQIRIQELALDLAQRLFQDNRTKVEIGTLAPIDTVTPEAQVATAEQNLLNAQIQWTNAELTLKRLLAAGPDDDIYKATINPTERPVLSVTSVDIAGAIQNAMQQRTDLLQAQRNLDISRLNLDVTKDLTRPQLDLTTGFNSSGQGGTSFANGEIVSQGTYTDALRALRTFDTSGWNLGFNFTLPFGRDMTINRIAYARALVQLDQSQAQIKAQELTINTDVTNAGLAVENTYKQFQAAQKNREAQERNAEAEQTRFDVGMSTNYNVVQAQNALTTARLTELQRLIAYLNAVAEFDRIQKVGR